MRGTFCWTFNRPDKEWVIRATVPGVDPSSVEVTFDGGQNVKGEIKPPADAKPESYWRARTSTGSSAAR